MAGNVKRSDDIWNSSQSKNRVNKPKIEDYELRNW